ncbi:MAG TPA: PAS domain S-box protein, partial [Bryobacteraceae bacterium]|nr:PAS domain S-box protein [Bryobacteraceae bacterium]
MDKQIASRESSATNIPAGVNGGRPLLFEGDALLAAIVESSDDAIISKDLNGIIRSWNKAAERIFGYTADEVIGKPISILAVPDCIQEMPEILARIQRGERVDHYETRRRAKDGRVLSILLSISPVRNPAGEIIGASKIARDITSNKRLRDSLEAQNRILEMIARGSGLDEVLNAICLAAEEQLPGGRCLFLLLRPETGRLHPVTGPHMPDSFWAGLSRGMEIGPVAGSCGTAAYRREPVIVCDVATDPLWAELKDVPLRAGFRAAWSRPILSDTGEVLGTFATYNTESRGPDPDEAEAINSWLHLASIAIARLRDEAALRESEGRLVARERYL